MRFCDLGAIETLTSELADHGNGVEPRRSVSAIVVVLAELACKSFGDLTEVLRLVCALVEIVVLETGNERVFVGHRVDRAYALLPHRAKAERRISRY